MEASEWADRMVELELWYRKSRDKKGVREKAKVINTEYVNGFVPRERKVVNFIYWVKYTNIFEGLLREWEKTY